MDKVEQLSQQNESDLYIRNVAKPGMSLKEAQRRAHEATLALIAAVEERRDRKWLATEPDSWDGKEVKRAWQMGWESDFQGGWRRKEDE